MKWIKINKDDIPNIEVVVANFEKGTYGYEEKLIGEIYVSRTNNLICCDNGHEILENCTHYIDINKFDIE